MSMETVRARELSCDRCGATLLVRLWQEARERGWTGVDYGRVQLCPGCAAAQKPGVVEEVLAEAGNSKRQQVIDLIEKAREIVETL